MKRIVRYITVLGLIAVLSAPVLEARDGRQGRGGNNGNRTEQSNNSGNNAPGRRPGGGTNRNPGHNQGGNRPGGGHQQGNRPGGGNHNPGHNQGSNRPGGGHQQGNRPGGGNHNPGHKPGHNRPGGYNPGHGPGHGHHHGHHGYRPAPPPRHDHWPRYHRPTPPPHYVCRGHGPSFGSILGMVLGTAYNVSLGYLYNNGYSVAGYGNDAIYLNNVSQMNYNWPNAVLYYNNGMLASSQYIYSTAWQDTGRYNMLYNTFCNQFGYPASINNTGLNLSATWFGYDGRFVTIQYAPGYNANGTGCYYTTLTFGN